MISDNFYRGRTLLSTKGNDPVRPRATFIRRYEGINREEVADIIGGQPEQNASTTKE